MNLGVFGRDRSDLMTHGWRAATQCANAAFPPHPDDPTGALVMPTMLHLVNQRVNDALKTTAPHDRRYWVEGFLLGLLEQVTTHVDAAAAPIGVSAGDIYAGLCADASRAPAIRDVVTIVAEVGSALTTADASDVMLELERLWLFTSSDPAKIGTRTTCAIACATSLCALAWELHGSDLP